MNKRLYKIIYKKIKKYPNIVIARHTGADPDALGSQLAFRDIIKNTFPAKNVYAVGTPAFRLKFMGILDKTEDEFPENTLLIVLDTPDLRRIDGVDISKFKEVIKIDHHPEVDKFSDLELIEESASSVCQMIMELVFNTKFKMTKEAAEKLFLGVVSDTNRFLYGYTSQKTLELILKLIKTTNIDFTTLYEPLYLRPLAEIRFQGYISQNFNVSENGLAHIKITDDLIKEFGVDPASSGNLVGGFNFINEITIWVIFSEDVKNNVIRATIRSRGPAINDIAAKYNGGGHKLAAGARLVSWDQANNLLVELEELAKNYKSNY